LRVHLKRARLLRDELHADDEHRRPPCFHDLRHGYATWLALRGEPELTIQTRLGHRDTTQTQRYIAEPKPSDMGTLGSPSLLYPRHFSHPENVFSRLCTK
jgi:integrase